MDGSTPRRILMTADTVGGVWTYALELARGLSQQGIEVILATMGPLPSVSQRRQAAAVKHLVLQASSYRLEWMAEPWDDVERAGEWLLGLAEKTRPDLVHLNGYAHAALPWPCPCLVVAHSCVVSWFEAVRREPAPESYAPYRRRVTEGLAKADLVTAPTAAMLASIERHYLPLTQGRVIHNARTPGRFRQGGKEEYILSVGRLWDEAKNIGTVAGVAPGLPWPVCVAGEERHPDGGTCLVNNVIRLGNLPPTRLAAWFAAAPIYALPARYEPFGLTILEAAMSGCALVLGDIPTLRELWDGAALFVPPDDAAALTEALTTLCTDRTCREALAAKALQRSSSFSPARMTREYLAAYSALLASQRRAQH